ncbi:MAG TPA: GDP-mannose pyrophosphatase NudK [Mucilaginibacter sp.]|jgi:nudix-type nucleoside diphosphatase (YffH/AdpP family)|nr:GDP-mannose pyrophosphatase NudK [Mucilaginibacter sp.]
MIKSYSPGVNILKTEILSNNWYTLKKITYEKTGPNGMAVVQSREAYDRGNGATILLYNRNTKSVILTRQFRMPTYINGNEDGDLIETCAGLLDKDNAEECIKRETEEETGYKITSVEKVFEAYMSPGSVTEILYFFVAEYSKDMRVGNGGGIEEEQEHIEVLEIPFDQAFAMINTGEIKDGKTIMLLQYALLKGLLN